MFFHKAPKWEVNSCEVIWATFIREFVAKNCHILLKNYNKILTHDRNNNYYSIVQIMQICKEQI